MVVEENKKKKMASVAVINGGHGVKDQIWKIKYRTLWVRVRLVQEEDFMA